jgi:diguanylate cyclase (GGDEF)-like protein
VIHWEQATSTLFRALRLETIRSKLLAVAVLATLIPSVTTAYLSYEQNKVSLTEKIGQALRTSSSQASRELDLWLKDRLIDLRVFANSEISENLASLRPGAEGSPAQVRMSGYLNSVRGRFLDYEELMVLDAQGHEVATSGKRGGPTQFPNNWLADIRGNSSVMGAPYRDNLLGKTIMVLAVPIHQAGGRLLGAIAARVNLTTVDEILLRSSPGESGEVYLLVGGRGLITTTNTGSAELSKTALPPEASKKLLEHEGLAVEYINPRSEVALGALNRIPLLGWSVVAEIPSSQAYRQVNHLRNVTIAIVLALLLGVGLLAYFLGTVIIRPLDRLTKGAAEVAGGDLAVDLPLVGGGEVADLTKVFNHMVARLRQGREELERLSVTDGLTGLFNRRHLIEHLASEVSRSRRNHHSFAVLMMDVDHFKTYNDTHGHLAGDEVLVRVSRILKESIRDIDFPTRYGGEEFLVLLPETSIDRAVEVAERIRTRLASETFAGGRITLSAGVASFPEFGETAEAVIMCADVALYEAKREGRDRVVRASSQQGTLALKESA